MAAGHTRQCLKVVIKKNFILKARSWVSTLLELALPVALMFLLILIRVEIKTKKEPAASYLNSPANNPTWFGASAGKNSALIPPSLLKTLAPVCNSTRPSGLCPEIFANATWGTRKEHYLGAAVDGLLLLHMALYNQQLGVVGDSGKALAQFIEQLPGYAGYVHYFQSDDDFMDYITESGYGFDEKKPQLFGAIHVNSVATEVNGEFSGDWDIVIQLNATGPGSLDFNGATDINTKLLLATNPLLKGLDMKTTKVYWSGGLFTSSGVPASTGGFVDLQALVYAWIYNSTGAFTLPRPDQLPKCLCNNSAGKLVEDFKQCKNISGDGQIALLTRLLTPSWSTATLGCLGRFSSLMPLSVREVPFPTPAYTKDTFATIVKSVFGLFFVLVFLWPLTRIMKSLVEDKENKINEVMKMMGMPVEAITFGWYITYGILWACPCLAIIVVCWTTVFQHSDKLIVFIFFWLFGLCVITFCSFVAVFFSKAKQASVVGSLVFFLLYFPYVFVAEPSIETSSKMLSCLCPPTALSFGAALIASLEGSGDGAQWSNLHLLVDNFSMGRVLFMMIFDTVLFAILAWYFDKVLVVGFGTRQPCCFFCTKRYWKPDTSALTQQETEELVQAFNDLQPGNPRYEPVSPNLATQRSVLIRGLAKEFSTADGLVLRAVDGVTVNLYNSQIFCLLGHNGAGKTTTINMLSGMMPVSDGDALMYGKSVCKDMPSIRKILGVCPQHDVIWGMLTVREHLEFFAELKGVSRESRMIEVESTIADVGLQEKQHALAGTMSGGQKRRLSAAIALIGGSKVVFLDEPSSGVDPFSRRELWDCLARKKEDRTLILTTHFMDEAEQLGDRIGIMAAGQIKCVGSSLFLKSQYGVGYTLTLAKQMGATANQTVALKEFIKSSCGNSELLSEVGTEISFRMPMGQSSKFPELFEKFEKSGGDFGIERFNVSVTTLEEVFLRVGQDHTQADMGAAERQEESSFVRQISRDSGTRRLANTAPPSAAGGRSSGDELNDDLRVPLHAEENGHTGRSNGGTGVFFRHTHAMLAKRFHNAKRDKKAWCCQIAMPLIFLLAALMSMKFQGVGQYPVSPVSISSLHADHQDVVYAAGSSADQSFAKQFMEGFDDAVERSAMDSSAFDADLLAHYARSDGAQRYGAYHFNYVPDWSNPTKTRDVPVAGGTFTVMGYKQPGALSSSILPRFTVPVGTLWNETVALPIGVEVPMSQLNNRLQVDLYWNSSARDAVPIFYHELHQQLLRTALKLDKKASPSVKLGNRPFPLTSSQKDLTDTQTSLNIALGFAFIPASFGAFVVLERETKSKHLQIISGVNFISYWFSTWLWDIINYMVPAACSILLIAVFGVDSLVRGANLFWTILCVIFYGISCSSFTYMISFLFESHTAAQNLLLVIYLFTGGILEIVAIVLAIIPSTQDLMKNVLIYLFRLLPNFCLADALTNLVTREAPGLWMEQGCPMMGCKPSDLVICGYDLLYMGLGSVVWFLITLVLELALATPRLRALFRLSTFDVVDDGASAPLDPDVQAEVTRVKSGLADDETVVVKGLRKVYKGRQGVAPKIAVEDMHFGIPEGECFGYLGMNGAGKTTTMKILTGEELCTRGEATLGGFNVMTQQNQVRRLIGYCPQFDALIGTLTAREHLMLFARIKGIPKDIIREYVDKLLDRLTLTQFADRQSGTFSGGTRRKLSLGIALVGDPRIVFLDEPTTGVDPESRRFMWKLISTTMQGRSVILTTHSMDECEALCSRIGIMVNGRLMCLGSASHLKDVHGSGYRLEVTFKVGVDCAKAFRSFSNFIQGCFVQGGVRCIEGEPKVSSQGATGTGTAPPAITGSQRVTFKLPKGQKPISAIFKDVEQARERLEISEYSISETTLDQIFIHFAKNQWNEAEPGQPLSASIGSFQRSFNVADAHAPLMASGRELSDSAGALDVETGQGQYPVFRG